MTDKEKAELMALRRRVEAQREEIRRLQAAKADETNKRIKSWPGHDFVEMTEDSMTVRQLWMATDEPIFFVDRPDRMRPLEASDGSKMCVDFKMLPLHVHRVRIMAPYNTKHRFFLVETEEALP